MNPLKALRDMRTIGRLLTDAEQIARRMGDERPSAEHLLIAAMGLPDGSAATVFATFVLDGARLETAVRGEHEAGLVAAGIAPETAARMNDPDPLSLAQPKGIYRSNPSAQELFQAAGTAAREAGQRLSGRTSPWPLPISSTVRSRAPSSGWESRGRRSGWRRVPS